LTTRLNSQIMNLVMDELDRTISRTNKSHQEIINTLVTLNPEVTFCPEDWGQMPIETQTSIISRIRKTLEAL